MFENCIGVFVENIIDVMDLQEKVILILLDLIEVFDRVNYELYKLERIASRLV